jgi:hypothetical protein
MGAAAEDQEFASDLRCDSGIRSSSAAAVMHGNAASSARENDEQE